MNPKSPTPPHLILQSLFDQELPVEEAQHLRENLSADDALRLKALEEIQLLTKTHATQEADDTNLSFLWDRIEARLDPPTPKAAPAPAQSPSWIDRLASLLGLDRRVVIPLLSIATIVVLVMLPQVMNRRPQAPPSGNGPSISADVAKNNATKPSNPTLDASPQAEPPQIIVIFNPSAEPQKDWLVKYPRPQTPVIWYTPTANDPSPAIPPTLPPSMIPIIQEVIKNLPTTPPATSPSTTPTNDPI